MMHAKWQKIDFAAKKLDLMSALLISAVRIRASTKTPSGFTRGHALVAARTWHRSSRCCIFNTKNMYGGSWYLGCMPASARSLQTALRTRATTSTRSKVGSVEASVPGR